MHTKTGLIRSILIFCQLPADNFGSFCQLLQNMVVDFNSAVWYNNIGNFLVRDRVEYDRQD